MTTTRTRPAIGGRIKAMYGEDGETVVDYTGEVVAHTEGNEHQFTVEFASGRQQTYSTRNRGYWTPVRCATCGAPLSSAAVMVFDEGLAATTHRMCTTCGANGRNTTANVSPEHDARDWS